MTHESHDFIDIDEHRRTVLKGLFGATALTAGLPELSGKAAAQADWWNTDWEYRKKVTITEESGNELTDYPLVFTFAHDGNARSNCDDIRVVQNGAVLPYSKKECAGSSVTLAVKQDLPSSNTTSFYVYYGNPDADSAAADWNEVRYNFYDDFEDGTLDWTAVEHSEFWSERDGQIHYSPSTSAGSTGDNWLYANETFDGDRGLLQWPLAIEFKAYASDTSAGIGASAAVGGPRDEFRPTSLAVADNAYDSKGPQVWNSSSEQSVFNNDRRDNTWYTYRLVPDPENDVVRLDRNGEEFSVSEPRDSTLDNVSIVLSGATCWGCGGNGDRRYEYVKIWKYMTPRPSISTGNEEAIDESSTGSESTESLPPIGDLSIRVIEINGHQKSRFGFKSDVIKNISIRLLRSDNEPVTTDSIVATVDPLGLLSEKITLTHQGNGVFSADYEGNTPPTQFLALDIGYKEDGETTRVRFPLIRSSLDPLRAPIPDWIYNNSDALVVSVEGSDYRAIEFIRAGEYEADIEGLDEYAWLVVDAEGRLVNNGEIRGKAALAATVAEEIHQERDEFIEYYGDTRPQALEKILYYTELAHWIITLRDTAAELLGTVVAGSLTGGTSQFAGQTVTQATKQVAKQLAISVVEEQLKNNIDFDITKDPIGAIKKAFKLQAILEINQSINQSRQAAAVLRRHRTNEPWSYKEALSYWENSGESMTDGNLYMNILVNSLPDADAQAQLEDVAIAAAEGTGFPAEQLQDLIESDELGYISESVEETARLRAFRALREKKHGAYSSELHQAAADEYGPGFKIYRKPGLSSEDATISIVDAPSGTFLKGDPVNTTVEITNPGTNPARFFIGYGATTMVDGRKTYFSNYGTTGHFVSVPAGESITAELSWTVQGNAPTGQRYGIGAAVWESYPEKGTRQYARVERADVLTVVDGTDIRGTSVEIAGSKYFAGERQTIVTEVENTGSVAGTTVVDLRVDDTVIQQESVTVPAKGTDSAVFTHTFGDLGKHTIESAGQTLSVSVEPPRSTTESTIGETGNLTVSQPNIATWQTVNLNRTYDNPVVLMSPLSHNGPQAAHLRVRNVQDDSFEFKVEEWQFLNGRHVDETVHYMVIEGGLYTFSDGTGVEAGTVEVNHEFMNVGFAQEFSRAPIVFSQSQTRNGSQPVVTRQKAISTGGYGVRLQEEEGNDGWHRTETVGYIAIEPGTGTNNGVEYEVGRTDDVTHAGKQIEFGQGMGSDAVFLAQLQTYNGPDTAGLRYKNLIGNGVDVLVEEERSRDWEVWHTNEVVGYAVFESVGQLLALE